MIVDGFCPQADEFMMQLEIGVLPFKRKIVEGQKVMFFVSLRGNKGRRTKKTYSHIGRIVSVEGKNAIIEDLVAPGSRFNRPIKKIFEVHNDTLWQAITCP